MSAKPETMRLGSLLGSVAFVSLLVACGADAQIPGDPSAPGGGDPAVGGGEEAAPAEPGESGGATPGANPGGGGPTAACIAQPSCDAAGGPTLGAKRAWKRSLSQYIVKAGDAYHRGRDQIVTVGEPQWVIGKFTYSYLDKDLPGEEVDVFVQRGCAGGWEKLGTATTTDTGQHAPVEGVTDDGARVFFEIPKDKALGAGRHRVRMVVAGDQTFADAILDVVPEGTPIFVSDVDGTLTENETAEYSTLLSGAQPPAHPKAADALAALASKGIRPVYVTSRPEWLTARTREFLAEKGFPPGIVVTTQGVTGTYGAFARDFKVRELARITAHGVKVAWAFGNHAIDAEAFHAAKIDPVDHRVFLRMDDPNGGRRIEAYSEILPTLEAAPATCK